MSQKLMFFLPTLGGGGAERTVIQLANSFVIENILVNIVVCDLRGKKSKLKSEIDPRINLINFDCGGVSNSILKLKENIQKNQYDCIISTQTHTNIICAFALMVARTPTKLILREVSTPSKNMKIKGLTKLIYKQLVNYTYKTAHKIVCVSNGVQQDFKEFYQYKGENLTTIYNPVINEAYLRKLDETVEHRYFKPENKVILAIGRLTEAKNFELLIRSFYQLYKQHPECRLIILGEGELRQKLELQIKNLSLSSVVDLPGFDSNPYAYFKYAELFVLSSSWEGLPGVLIQALASKIKIVSTNCPSGPYEILAKSKYGILVECNDIRAMTSAIEDALFGNYVLYDLLNLEQHCLQFSKDNILDSYLTIIREK